MSQDDYKSYDQRMWDIGKGYYGEEKPVSGLPPDGEHAPAPDGEYQMCTHPLRRVNEMWDTCDICQADFRHIDTPAARSPAGDALPSDCRNCSLEERHYGNCACVQRDYEKWLDDKSAPNATSLLLTEQAARVATLTAENERLRGALTMVDLVLERTPTAGISGPSLYEQARRLAGLHNEVRALVRASLSVPTLKDPSELPADLDATPLG